MINAIIIDDEENARQLLSAIISEHCPDIQIIDLCNDVPSAVKSIKKHKPTLIFLDIQMPVYSGLELFEFFNEDELDFDTIFVTAYNEYAIQAIKFSALDYILKPVHQNELLDAIERYNTKVERQENSYKTLTSNLQNQVSWMDKRLIVPTNKSIKYLIPKDIVFIKADSAYSTIYTKNGESIVASKNLGYFQDLLSPIKQFFRCHKSYLVNLEYLEEHIKSESILKLKGGYEVGINNDKTEEIGRLVGL